LNGDYTIPRFTKKHLFSSEKILLTGILHSNSPSGNTFGHKQFVTASSAPGFLLEDCTCVPAKSSLSTEWDGIFMLTGPSEAKVEISFHQLYSNLQMQ